VLTMSGFSVLQLACGGGDRAQEPPPVAQVAPPAAPAPEAPPAPASAPAPAPVAPAPAPAPVAPALSGAAPPTAPSEPGTPPGLKYESDGGPGIRRIMELLLGSTQPSADRRDFLRTQIVFWLLCAIDGHAKNFSVFLLPQSGYRLTPRYDVLSAYPVLGHGVGKLHSRKVKMAMAVEGTSRHYHWDKIMRRHWVETATRCGMGDEIESIVEETIDATPQALAAVSGKIPQGFPAVVADSILSGVEAAAKRLREPKI